MRRTDPALPWVLAAVALLLAALLGLVLTPRWQHQAQAYEAAATQAAAATPGGPVAADPAAALPGAARRAERTDALLAQAQRLGLELLSVEQRLVDDEGVQRNELSLVARCRYDGLRAFVQAALAADPALALLTLRLAHDEAAPGQLQARLDFVMLQRAQLAS